MIDMSVRQNDRVRIELCHAVGPVSAAIYHYSAPMECDLESYADGAGHCGYRSLRAFQGRSTA